MTDLKVKIARQFIGAIPHSQAFGMVLSGLGERVAEIIMPYDERLIGEVEPGEDLIDAPKDALQVHRILPLTGHAQIVELHALLRDQARRPGQPATPAGQHHRSGDVRRGGKDAPRALGC